MNSDEVLLVILCFAGGGFLDLTFSGWSFAGSTSRLYAMMWWALNSLSAIGAGAAAVTSWGSPVSAATCTIATLLTASGLLLTPGRAMWAPVPKWLQARRDKMDAVTDANRWRRLILYGIALALVALRLIGFA